MTGIAMRRAVLLIVLVGCAGQPPQGPADDGSGGPPPELGQTLSGHVIDYFASGAVDGSTITTDGIDPAATTTSGVDGSWQLDHVPLGSKVFLSVAHAGYRTTRNVATAVTGDISQDLFVISEARVVDQYTALSVLPTAGTAVVFAEMRDAAGPLEGIPLANIKLLDAANQPVPNLALAFFGATDVDPNQTTAIAVGGRSRVALLDVPPGTYTLKVTFTANGAPVATTTPIVATTDGAVLALTKP